MSDDLIDPADPQYELKVAEWFQKTVDGPREGDDLPVVITVRQAQKMAAIMSAVVRGHSGYVDALGQASWFLTCAVFEATPGHGQTSQTAAEAWVSVDGWPWPRPGKPRKNADERGAH